MIHWIQSVPHAYCGKSHAGKPCGWNPTHTTNFHNVAVGTENFDVKMLAKMSPNHPLVQATGTNTPAGPKNPPSADTEESGDTSGSYNTLQHGRTVLAQLERSAKSDEARGIIDSVREALGK